MGKKTKVPDAPDYGALAQQQAVQAKDAWGAQNQANRPNQTNQFGSLQWSQDPTTGQWTQSNTLNTPQQGIFNQQQANQQQLADLTGGATAGYDASQINFSGAPGMPQVGQYNQQATDLFNQLAQPGLDRQTDAARARMAAMGGSEFGSQAGTNMNQQLADMVSRSNMMGAQAGIQQGNEMFNQGMNLHNTGVNDITNQKAANLAQLQGLYGLGQQVGTPQYNPFTATGAYQTPDLMGAAQNQYSAQMDKTNASNADKSNTASTIGTVASVAAVAF